MKGEWREAVGNIHMHTLHSDGAGTFDQLREAAQAAGLDFIIVTDHNVLKGDEEGLHDGLLVLVGAEIHHEGRQPEGNHLLCLAITENPVDHAPNPQALIDAVNGQGGMAFLAHPFERTSPLLSDSYPWHSWKVTGFQGIELWNYMSEFRPYATSRLVGLLISLWPAFFSRGPWPETLARWDELARQRPVVALGGSDVHAQPYKIGPWRRIIFPYEHCYRSLNTHILLPQELRGDYETDRQAVYGALQSGHCWVGYDLIGRTEGFRFNAESGGAHGIMGDTLPLAGSARLQVRLPAPADLHLLRNGQVISQGMARELAIAVDEPGVYRVEAWRNAWGKPRGWIFSNPIYVI